MGDSIYIQKNSNHKPTYEELVMKVRDYEQRIATGELIPAPCKVGDTIYWVDAVRNIYPVVVAGFSISPVDEIGHTYLGNFNNGGLHLTKESAEKQVYASFTRKCERCYKRRLREKRGSCNQDCRHIDIRELNKAKWDEDFRSGKTDLDLED